MAYGDIIEYNGKKYRCINPNLTSNNTPTPYYAHASEEYIYNSTTGYGHAFCVFTDRPSGVAESSWGWSPSAPPNWIGLYLEKQEKVDLITFKGDAKKRTITIYGGNNTTDLVELKTFTHNFGFLVPHYVELSENLSYSYYRIHTSNNYSNEWNDFAAIRFYQEVKEERYLIEENNSFKTITANGLQEAIKENIMAEGFTDPLLIKDVYSQLDNNFSILRFSLDSANTSIKITHLPPPQLILPVEDIDLSAYHQIHQLSLTTTGAAGAVKMVFSFDKGETWQTFSDGAWQQIALSIDTVQASGITPEMLSVISSERWNQAVTGTLRVAYCLSKSTVTDDLAVDTLAITGNVATWRKAQHMVDYDYEYPNPKTLLVHLLADGSYKINYTM